MIITVPQSLRHEEEITPSYYEDHLLERVTLLELRLSQVTEQLAMAYEFIAKQSESFEKDHLIIQSFLDSINKINPEFANDLVESFGDSIEAKTKKRHQQSRKRKILEEIYLNHDKPNLELFSHLVEEGISLLENNEEKQGFRTLERAILLSPKNIPLLLFVSQKLFEADKFDSAKIYLENIFDLVPQEKKALLLLGVICANQRETENARKFLSVLANYTNTMVCANYVWGILAAFEHNWKEAIVAFKECLEIYSTPEINYLIGCCYFQLNDYDNALNFLQNSIELDDYFADAWFMISVVHSNLNNQEKFNYARNKAFEAKEAGSKCLKFYKQKDFADFTFALPFLHFGESDKKLLTNASVRLNKFIRKMVLETISNLNSN